MSSLPGLPKPDQAKKSLPRSICNTKEANVITAFTTSMVLKRKKVGILIALTLRPHNHRQTNVGKITESFEV
jgi:hypothetical protein